MHGSLFASFTSAGFMIVAILQVLQKFDDGTADSWTYLPPDVAIRSFIFAACNSWSMEQSWPRKVSLSLIEVDMMVRLEVRIDRIIRRQSADTPIR